MSELLALSSEFMWSTNIVPFAHSKVPTLTLKADKRSSAVRFLFISVKVSSISRPSETESSRYSRPPDLGDISPMGTQAVREIGPAPRRKLAEAINVTSV
jgi:hypothetical protein